MVKEPTVWIDLFDEAHAAFAAGRTLPDVDTYELEKFFASGLRRGFFRLGRREQLTAARDLLPSSSIGEQAVVADPHEALREDVEQEATDELVLIELHELLLVGVGGVAHSERDATVLDAADARVRDRDAMGSAMPGPPSAFESPRTIPRARRLSSTSSMNTAAEPGKAPPKAPARPRYP